MKRKQVKILLQKLTRSAVPVLVFTFVLFFVLQLNVFYVGTIDIHALDEGPLNYIDVGDIESETLPYLGKRLFSIKTGEIETLLDERFPFIDRVYVSKRIPDTILIRIIEHQPSFVLSMGSVETLFSERPADERMIVDQSGNVLAACADEPDICSDLKGLSAIGNPLMTSPGDTVSLPYFSELIALSHELSVSGIDYSGIAVPHESVAVVQFADTSRGVFSLSGNISAQMNSYVSTTESLNLEGRTFKEIDFRFNQPVLRVDKYSDWMTE